jgi:LysR family glycine cleavage system transcriptional activator
MLTASPSIASKWLVPRLEHFLRIAPEADIRIDVSSEPLDFGRDEIDVAIRFGDGNYPGLSVEPLFEETVFPVCGRKTYWDIRSSTWNGTTSGLPGQTGRCG